jgi:DNA polymerase-1
MFVPGDGMVFVYADADQLELRLIAALAHSARYLDIFNNGGDAHAISASLAFGAKFDVLQKDSPDWESMRKFAKILSYASGYGANIDTVLDVIRSVEDDAGNLLYANVTKAEATKIHSNWLEGAGVRDWWERNMDTFRKQKYMAEPVWGRRRDVLDGEDFCAIQNFGCQAGGAAIMHEAVLEVVDAIPFEKWGPGTGLVNYMHDAVLVACPEKEADKVVEIVNAAMNRSTPALPVRFTSKAKIKKRWSEPKKKAA